ncbi:MAG: HU family DNA-binding protein [Muribaculaceae bacterium]|nr:HU family DNA-binding protein [Muribaculaceae bacterium]
MENKVTLSLLSSSLSKNSDKSKKACEEFLREFFKLAAEVLEEGEILKIKGFGTFKISEIESRESVSISTGERHELKGYKRVSFTPSKELASIINAPFEDFETMEIEEEMPEDILKAEFIPEASEDDNISNENSVSEYRLEEGSEEEGKDDLITYEAYADIEVKDQSENKKEKESEEKENETPQDNHFKKEEIVSSLPIEIKPQYPEIPRESRFKSGFLYGAICSLLVCVVIFMLGCFFDWWPVNFGKSGKLAQEVELVNEEPLPVAPDEEPALMVEEPVYDTVSTTRYLTTIAREHYGNFNFWPYIYLENESILGHPDRITPGTKVIVPPLSKYGVNPEDAEDIARAKQKGLEIYARFK